MQTISTSGITLHIRDEGPRDVDDDIVDADFEDLGENKRK